MSGTPDKTPPAGGGKRARAIFFGFLAVCVLYLLAGARPPKDVGDFQTTTFGRLPVVDQGRIKPIDTLARTSLMILSNKQSLWVVEDGATTAREGSSERGELDNGNRRKMGATEWLLDVMAKPGLANEYRVFRIDHPEIVEIVQSEHTGHDHGSAYEAPPGTTRKYFSAHEILAHREVLNERIDQAMRMASGDRTPYHRALLRVQQQLGIFFSLQDVVGLILVPPMDGHDWRTIQQVHPQFGDELAGPVQRYVDTLSGWNQDSPGDFNEAVAGLSSELAVRFPDIDRKVRIEAGFHHFAPFAKASAIYVLIFLAAVLFWVFASPGLQRAAMWMLVIALVVQTVGIILRIWIQGRPPVTNLYSSAIFVGWGCAVFGLIYERLFRNGVGSVTAAVTGFISLLVAHHLSLDGDTMTMMQAVLDTNFWLATHVVVITLGYSATFLAGFLGTLYIVRAVLTPRFTREDARSLSSMLYGTLCFAILFSFVGTILGGIWADQSWGRFWGWDPKENGALLIVLWNALVLHARWGGLAKQRGIAALAVFGNVVTAWSWFGTNMLGVGLHAYGFIDSALFWMFAFVVSQAVIMGLAYVPQRFWISNMYQRSKKQAPARHASGTGMAAST